MHSRFAHCISKPRTSLGKGGVVCWDTVSDLPSCLQVKFFPSESSWGGAGWSGALGRRLSCPYSCPWVNWEGSLCFLPLLPPLWHPICLWGWCLPSSVLTSVGNLSSCLPAFSFHLCCWNRPLGWNRTPLLPRWPSSLPRPTVCPNTTPLLPKRIHVMFLGNRRGGSPCSQPSRGSHSPGSVYYIV